MDEIHSNGRRPREEEDVGRQITKITAVKFDARLRVIAAMRDLAKRLRGGRRCQAEGRRKPLEATGSLHSGDFCDSRGLFRGHAPVPLADRPPVGAARQRVDLQVCQPSRADVAPPPRGQNVHVKHLYERVSIPRAASRNRDRSERQRYMWQNRLFGSLRTPFRDAFVQNPRSPNLATGKQRLRLSSNCQKPAFATHRAPPRARSTEPGSRSVGEKWDSWQFPERISTRTSFRGRERPGGRSTASPKKGLEPLDFAMATDSRPESRRPPCQRTRSFWLVLHEIHRRPRAVSLARTSRNQLAWED